MKERHYVLPLRCSHLEAYWSSLPVRGERNRNCDGFMRVKVYGWNNRQNGVYQSLICGECGEHAPDVPTYDSAVLEEE